MALNTNPFVEGIDPTSTFGGYASVLLQLIRQAQPSSTYGMVLFDTTAPDVTGANAWRKRCIWLDLTNPALPTVNVYRESAPGWVNVNNIIGNNVIVTAMIANLAVTIAKLSPAGGTANQLIRVNASATAFEFVALSSIVTPSSILPSAISGIAVLPGTFRVLGNLNGGTTTWYHPDQVVQGVSDAVIDVVQIAPSGTTSARSSFITTRTADVTAAWRYFDPNVDILAAAMNGNRLTDFTVSVSKISPGAAVEGSLLSIVGGVPDWIPAPTASYVHKFESAEVAIPAAAGAITPIAHGLAAAPQQFNAVLKCTNAAGDIGYPQNAEISVNLAMTTHSANDESSSFGVYADATSIYCRRNSAGNIFLINAATGAAAGSSINTSFWRLKFYAWH
jgi:hypothetical protein